MKIKVMNITSTMMLVAISNSDDCYDGGNDIGNVDDDEIADDGDDDGTDEDDDKANDDDDDDGR